MTDLDWKDDLIVELQHLLREAKHELENIVFERDFAVQALERSQRSDLDARQRSCFNV